MMQRNRKASVSTVSLRGIHVCEKIDAMRVFQPPLLCHGSIWRWPLRSIEEVQWSSMWENETSSPEILKIRPFFPAISVDLTDLNYYGRQIKGFFQNHSIGLSIYNSTWKVFIFSYFKNKHEQMCLAHISHLVFHLLLQRIYDCLKKAIRCIF